jgi:hypothetical protein
VAHDGVFGDVRKKSLSAMLNHSLITRSRVLWLLSCDDDGFLGRLFEASVSKDYKSTQL